MAARLTSSLLIDSTQPYQLLTAITLADVLYIVDRTVSTRAPFKKLNKNIRVKRKIKIESEIGIKSNRVK